ncbi:MAG: hypothetical protein ACE5FV_14825, partial [Woeseia sp.]
AIRVFRVILSAVTGTGLARVRRLHQVRRLRKVMRESASQFQRRMGLTAELVQIEVSYKTGLGPA